VRMFCCGALELIACIDSPAAMRSAALIAPSGHLRDRPRPRYLAPKGATFRRERPRSARAIAVMVSDGGAPRKRTAGLRSPCQISASIRVVWLPACGGPATAFNRSCSSHDQLASMKPLVRRQPRLYQSKSWHSCQLLFHLKLDWHQPAPKFPKKLSKILHLIRSRHDASAAAQSLERNASTKAV
jgi:hypothetical protein